MKLLSPQEITEVSEQEKKTQLKRVEDLRNQENILVRQVNDLRDSYNLEVKQTETKLNKLREVSRLELITIKNRLKNIINTIDEIQINLNR